MNIFKEAPDLPVTKSKEEIDKTYRYWRWQLMIVSYIGYAVFYFTRKSFNFVMPDMLQDLGLHKADIGIMGTAFYLTYGVSKFISGMLGDRSNPRYFMGIGLMMTGVVNILFGMSSSVFMFVTLWIINAFFQGWGWPPCAKLLTSWYSRNERGLWWAFWNTSHNVGGALIPILAGAIAMAWGWRYGMIIPGALAIIIGIVLCLGLRDRPTSMGLPTVGQWRNDEAEKKHESEGIGLSAWEILREYIFKNSIIWILAFSYCCVYIIRTGINDWGNLYLMETHHYDILKANATVSFFEIGGFLGALFAGWGSDKIFKGNRSQMNIIYVFGIIAVALALWIVPTHNYYVMSSLFFLMGFFIFGPQFMIGMAAAEMSHKHAAATATGFVSLFAYGGAAISGYPLSLIIQHFKWHGFFSTLFIISVASAALLIIVHILQRRHARQQKLATAK
ncbi:regulatory protein UhpC [Actinobacillus delphinicola]|uniref:MFS transporter family glucose-6-phosphate receptor UhpC n=1 Tax=Actinobacillus delphinicola TaxID=51161 RepID=UPI002440EE57|nr:MFS transporter family glucose-6-phosphate receptor UhpC [Actinobacillus delphinicola]MDG6897669.1 regulatory protein UhpC [Actinobacillus delphinicola]